jgi:uncharacterized repeat protein (TIGR03803 family)
MGRTTNALGKFNLTGGRGSSRFLCCAQRRLPYLRRLSPPSSASAKRAAYSPAGLVQGTNGDFYGTTAYGGNGGGCPFPNIGCGRLFKITPGGAPTTLYSFCSQIGCPDGEYPYAGLIQATNGEFYGTTVSGGNAGEGSSTIVKISPNGTLTTLYTFDGTQGIYPDAGLIQATNGDFYGTTQEGGTYDVVRDRAQHRHVAGLELHSIVDASEWVWAAHPIWQESHGVNRDRHVLPRPAWVVRKHFGTNRQAGNPGEQPARGIEERRFVDPHTRLPTVLWRSVRCPCCLH